MENNMLTKPRVAFKIITTGTAQPETRIPSTDLDNKLGKPAGYVEKRSGIAWRYHASQHTCQAELAAQALHNALKAGHLAPDAIDLLICASAVAVQALPFSAIHILKAANMPDRVAAFDINSSCVSFISALEVASGLLNAGLYKRIAIVSADIASRGLNWEHEESSFIFGDGAACAIVERGEGQSGMIASLIETYTDGSELCEIRAGGSRCHPRTHVQDSDFFFQMKGKPLFRYASSLIEDFFGRLMQKSGLTLADVATVVPHQASHLSLEHTRKRLQIPESAFVDIYRNYGNQVSASIPTALHEAIITNRFNPGKPTVLIGTAAGLTLAGMVILP